MAKKISLKNTSTPALQSREAVQLAIQTIGDLQREIAEQKATADEAACNIALSFAKHCDPLADEIKQLSRSVQGWCEANRSVLCPSSAKTADLGTGEVSWRFNPPKCVIKNEEHVVNQLRAFGWTKYLHVKTTVNREAVLAEPPPVSVLGLEVKDGDEVFSITPIELAKVSA